jgi:hypothetical protein
VIPYMIQGKNIVLVIDNKQHTINTSHLSYEKIRDAIKAADWDTVRKLINPEVALLDFGQGNIEVKGNRLFWQGRELKNALTKKIIAMIDEGFGVEPLVNFMDNLMQNPSMTAVNELYRFLEVGNLPITPDGHFLAFKKVRDNYMDVHSETVLNKPAPLLTEEELAAMPMQAGRRNETTVEVVNGETVVSMPRNAVDDQRNRTCSAGLHFCSLDYLKHFGGERIVILKINPADVVSIPSDYNDTKGRTWRYVVTGELETDPEDALKGAVQVGA